MSKQVEHEKYLLKSILSKSLSSENPSRKTINEGYKTSDSYFKSFKEDLLEKYKDKQLKDIKGSKVISTNSGETLQIKKKEKINFKLDDNNFKENIRTNLKLLPRIGIYTEIKLKNEGYKTIDSLKKHDRYSNQAKILCEKIDNISFCELLDLLNQNKYGKECKNNLLKSACLTDKENFKFMDIETLGLSNLPIILIGVAEIKDNNIISNQYLLMDKIEEPAVLEGYLSHLDEDSVHVTYNGASFDIPFIKNRCNYYNIPHKLNIPHFDLIYFARNMWKDKLPNCKLTTIEEYLFDIKRENDVPGSYIPSYYETYLNKNNIGPLVPIIDHNRQDMAL